MHVVHYCSSCQETGELLGVDALNKYLHRQKAIRNAKPHPGKTHYRLDVLTQPKLQTVTITMTFIPAIRKAGSTTTYITLKRARHTSIHEKSPSSSNLIANQKLRTHHRKLSRSPTLQQTLGNTPSPKNQEGIKHRLVSTPHITQLVCFDVQSKTSPPKTAVPHQVLHIMHSIHSHSVVPQLTDSNHTHCKGPVHH
jgi:hypothetical protein